jgi:hypothetical protein
MRFHPWSWNYSYRKLMIKSIGPLFDSLWSSWA